MQERWGLVCLLVSALAGCGAGDTVSAGPRGGIAVEAASPEATATGRVASTPAPQVDEEGRAALLAQADRLADEHVGRAVRVEAVRTRSSTARAVTGWWTQEPDEEVWVLAISGDEYFCRYCSGPSDEGKSSKHLTLTVLAEHPSGERLTFGMSMSPYDLSAFGTVQVLRG